MLKPQDVLCACKIYSLEVARQEWSYADLAREVGLSQGEAHNAVERAKLAQLLTPAGAVDRRALRDVLAVALPRMCFTMRGGITSGMPTAQHAPPVREKFAKLESQRPEGSMPGVWPHRDDEDGLVCGWSLEPVYSSVPHACRNDSLVYELLALVDVVRVGSAQDRQVAVSLIDKRLGGK